MVWLHRSGKKEMFYETKIDLLDIDVEYVN
jgi:hypothetical protein